MRWMLKRQNPRELHSIFLWFPIIRQRAQYEDEVLWLETVYRERNDMSLNNNGYWAYYTVEEMVKRNLVGDTHD